MSRLNEAVEFAQNPDPRCPCVLLLDTSGSMDGVPIDLLNKGLVDFQKDVQQDALAERRVEVAIVTFGNGGVQTMQDFVTAGQFAAPRLTAGGMTPMGEAINRSIDLVRARKATYRNNGIAHYRPWIFMVTDGEPTDEWSTAAAQVRAEEAANGLAFFAVGVEGANMNTLGQIAVRPPLKLNGLNFREMFLWLSNSQKRVSASKPGDQTALPPVGWATV